MAREWTADDGGELPDYCTAGVLVLGCGNPLMGDDGFGPAVAELLLGQGAGRKAQGARLEAQGTGRRAQGDGTTEVPGSGSLEPCALRLAPSPPAPCALRLAPSLCIINAGTGSRGMIFNMVTGPARPKAIIIVDALRAGRRPGELFWVDIEDLSLEKAEDFSLHMTPASNMLFRLRQLGVDIRILACEPKDLPEVMTEGLSDEVEAAVGPAAKMAMDKARELLGGGGHERGDALPA
ncbi:MAG: hydrogenase maturation protease [Euryarchaeota archaeon]|nr:hydrogenase maturation protease [Euryarchaeota archaeon]